MNATRKLSHLAAWTMMTFNLTLLAIILKDWQAYEMKIIQAPFVPVTLIDLLIWLVPALLILSSAGLATDKYRQAGWGVNLLIQSLMSFYFLLLITGSTGTPCACGGLLAPLSIEQHLYLHLLLAGFTLLLMLMSFRKKEPRPLTTFRHTDSQVAD